MFVFPGTCELNTFSSPGHHMLTPPRHFLVFSSFFNTLAVRKIHSFGTKTQHWYPNPAPDAIIDPNGYQTRTRLEDVSGTMSSGWLGLGYWVL